jgi:trehalose 6-phosphate synthase
VLILSRFAGAAAQMTEALLVNPYSKDEISDAIRQAIDMPKKERITRWQALHDNIRDEDVVWWRRKFVDALQSAGEHAQPAKPESGDKKEPSSALEQ